MPDADPQDPQTPTGYFTKADLDAAIREAKEKARSEERDKLYARQAQAYPGFGEYQANTTRVIPVIALRRTISVSSGKL